MYDKSPLILGIGGSIRNRASIDEVKGVDREVGSDELLNRIQELEHRDIYDDDFLGEIQPLLSELVKNGQKLITNSDALVLTALYGAMDIAQVEFVKLTEYIGVDTSYSKQYVDENRLRPLAELVDRADGLVLGSPVYFGDRSSLMHTFINYASDQGLLEGTVVGTVSVGSKRNGGQETANVYALFENLNQGGIVVGNGPKTCQYGGTGWGGDIGDVTNDDFGLETSLGTGLRVSRVAEIRQRTTHLSNEAVANMLDGPFRIGIVVTRDKDRRLLSALQHQFEILDPPNVELNIIDFSRAFIQACIGCDICPTPAKVEEISGAGKDYKCIIDTALNEERWSRDDLQDLHGELMNNDALVVAVLDTEEDGIDDVYQALLERTRYIRRDDWRLHNTPLAAYVMTTPNVQSTYPMKIMTSWMRHNTIIHEPIVHTVLGADIPAEDGTIADLESHYNRDARKTLNRFVQSAKRFRVGAQLTGTDVLSYKATGYRNKILDDTVAERS